MVLDEISNVGLNSSHLYFLPVSLSLILNVGYASWLGCTLNTHTAQVSFDFNE